MYFKTSTIYKVYGTRKGAEAYIARHSLTNVAVEVIDNKFFVVG